MGWSILMTIGAIIGRHAKQWDPTWFYLHASIQTTGFVGGVVGNICGLFLTSKVSSDVTHHKNIGLVILILGFLQVNSSPTAPFFSFFWPELMLIYTQETRRDIYIYIYSYFGGWVYTVLFVVFLQE